MKTNNKLGRSFFSIASLTFVALLVLAIFFLETPRNNQVKEVNISQIVTEVNEDRVSKIVVEGNKLTATTKDNVRLIAFKEAGQGLADYGITPDEVIIEVKNPDAGAVWTTVLSLALPFLILGFLIYFFLRQVRTGSSQAMNFGRSSARVYEGKRKVTFADVAGLKNAKTELSEIVDFLKNPLKYRQVGAEIPRGVLLYGPAGVGKTLLAKAVAGEAGVPFLSLSASEFVEMFVGVGASRVRDLFMKAKKLAPTVIFIDELDAVGRQRGTGLGGSHDEREQTLNQILVEMDGFDTETSVIVIAATNRPDVLDPALLRPGRFDRKVVLDLPDRDERAQILAIHAQTRPLSPSVNLNEIAKSTPGLSGAELRNIINEAAILAARDNRKKIEQKDLRSAIEKEMLGPERSSYLLKDHDRQVVAYHEAGHAIVGHVLSELDDVHKVSIVSRGMALGFTLSLPEEDRKLIPQKRFEQEVVQLLAGRAAEQLIFGQITTGSSNDVERATAIARNMVTIFGMSELGPIKLGERQELVFLGRDMGWHKTVSEEVAAKIDKAIGRIIEDSWQEALKLLKRYKTSLKTIAETLLEKETLEDEELRSLFATIKG